MSKVSRINDGGWCRLEKSYEDSDSNGIGKIDLKSQPIFSSHRSGWRYAIEAIEELHSPNGILFDGFLEKNFAWEYSSSKKKELIPYKDPWVGVFHNPLDIPEWFLSDFSLRKLINKGEFQDSLSNCKGIYTLSTSLANELSSLIDVPINSLLHPTETPRVVFDYNKFLNNSEKKVITVGWWLRKLNSIYSLPLCANSPYSKVRLLTYTKNRPRKTIDELMRKEREEEDLFMYGSTPVEYEENTLDMNRLSDEAYDDLLSKNIIFLDLYKSSANNALIESITRTTPVLINRLPSTEEYLGEDYPFYFESLEEAAKKALDLDLVKETHEYLKSYTVREKLSAENFRKSFEQSEIYQSL